MPKVDVVSFKCLDEQEPGQNDGHDEVYVAVTRKDGATHYSLNYDNSGQRTTYSDIDAGETVGVVFDPLGFANDGFARIRLWEDDGPLGPSAEDDLIGGKYIEVRGSFTPGRYEDIVLEGNYSKYLVTFDIIA